MWSCRHNYDVELVSTRFAGHLYDTMQALHRTDLFLGMHGAGMANIMWLPVVCFCVCTSAIRASGTITQCNMQAVPAVSMLCRCKISNDVSVELSRSSCQPSSVPRYSAHILALTDNLALTFQWCHSQVQFGCQPPYMLFAECDGAAAVPLRLATAQRRGHTGEPVQSDGAVQARTLPALGQPTPAQRILQAVSAMQALTDSTESLPIRKTGNGRYPQPMGI